MKNKTVEGHELYHLTGCPFCIKVRMAMWWMGIKLPLRNIGSHADYRRELIAGGGTDQVPCLRIAQGNGDFRWLYESADIIRYLKTAHD